MNNSISSMESSIPYNRANSTMHTCKKISMNAPVFNRICHSILGPLENVKVVLKFTFALLLSISLLTGCSSTPSYVAQSGQSVALSEPVDLTNQSNVKRRLLSQYHDWKGAPYRYGGTSRNGVDCSAFVQNTFHNQLGYQLPRTTRTQIKSGSKVAKTDLKVGDIVFFKTGVKSLHNGIYIGASEFIHASSSKGVTISSLDNRYWQKTYLTSIRVR